ncbi:MAG: FHA domain-containing protein [Candidatus Promineifilaceae bacterium]
MKHLRLLSLLLLLLLPQSTFAQTDVGAIEITEIDNSNYPAIAVSFTAKNQDGAGIEQIEGLQLTENGNPIEAFELVTLPSGVDVTFVIDANRTIEGIDLIGDTSRLEKVRQTIADFAVQYVSRTNSDRISVIAPNDGQPQFLLRDVTDPDLIAAGIRAYTPPQLPAVAPVQTMLEFAFEQAAQREPTDKYQAIVLFSDTELLGDQVDFFALRELAQQSDVVFFGAILGKVASDAEVENINELAIPTDGSWIHMPDQASFEPLTRIIKSNSSRSQVRYRSTLTQSGSGAVQLGLGGVSAETQYEIEIRPALIDIIQGDPLIREGDPGTDLNTFEPRIHPITAQVSWPDEYPRAIDNVRLFVNGLEQRLVQPPILDTRGTLTFVWDISNLGTGTYQLEVEVTDELGISQRSSAKLQRIEAESIQPQTAATEQVPTPVPTNVPNIVTDQIERVFGQTAGWLTPGRLTYGLIGLVALLFVVLLFKWAKRTQEAEESAEIEPEQNVLILPENVYLELMSDDRSPSHLIPIKTETVSIGSDPFKADIILDSSSVSRLHARIVYENSQYVLYDEGSAYGTRINYERVGLAPRLVVDGDELTFGKTRMRFRIFGVEDAYVSSQSIRPNFRTEDPPPHLTGAETPYRDRPISEETDKPLPTHLLEETKKPQAPERPSRPLRRTVKQPARIKASKPKRAVKTDTDKPTT